MYKFGCKCAIGLAAEGSGSVVSQLHVGIGGVLDSRKFPCSQPAPPLVVSGEKRQRERRESAD